MSFVFIFRFTPSLAMVVLLSVSFFKYLGNGPFWIAVIEAVEKPCEKNWWSTLLYLQNYINPDKIVCFLNEKAILITLTTYF